VPTVFEPSDLNGMTLSNRFIRSATWEGLAAPDGSVTEALVDSMRALAEGGVGLIISGHAFVGPEGRAGQWQLSAGSDEFIPGGMTVEDMLETVAILEAAGLDAVELSGGTFLSSPEERSMRVPRDPLAPPEPYYEEAAIRFKEKSRLPLMLVGGIRTYETAERLVSQGIADYIALSRPLICEPDLVRRWESGDLRPSACRSDNRCFIRALKGRGLECV
jgi:2,4-dienoyl-CoA reductase-like NADH-dependent reductase (Old Yellow Enzyme family)